MTSPNFVAALLVCFASMGCDPGPFEVGGRRVDAGATQAGRDAAVKPADGAIDSGQKGQNSSGIDRMARDAGAGRDGRGGADQEQAGSKSAEPPAAAGSGGERAEMAGASGEEAGAEAGASGSTEPPVEICERTDTEAPVKLRSMQEAGTVASPASIVLRIPGPITLIGGKLVWLFPKTNRAMGAIGADAAPNQPNAAFVTREDPTTLEEDLDPDGFPRRFLTADDMSPMTELWPTALLRVPGATDEDPATGVAFVRSSPDFVSYDVLVGRVARNTTAAQEPLTPLFTGSDAKFSTGGFRGGEYGYLFACSEDTTIDDRAKPEHFPCKIARAKLGELEQRDSYRVYDPGTNDWVADLSAGGPVIFGPPSALSLSHNNYLGRYLAVYSRWFSYDLVVQSAKSPWGPWREEFTITLPTPAVSVVQWGLEQPALNGPDECARSIWISYLSPTAESGGYPNEAEIKLVRVEVE